MKSVDRLRTSGKYYRLILVIITIMKRGVIFIIFVLPDLD